MSFSLNEIDAMAKRATRGVGYSWGLAEEAGKATRWLCARGVDGVEVLAEVLEGKERKGNPLLIGVQLSDRAVDLRTASLTFQDVRCPVMTLPFAAMAALQIGEAITVTVGDAVAVTDGHELSIAGVFRKDAAHLTAHSGGQLGAHQPHFSRTVPSPRPWHVLNHLAERTYAPATEESRLLGAGAGLSDND